MSAEPDTDASGAPARSSDETEAAESALRVLRVAPPLALMAVVAALFELALARLGYQGLADVIDEVTVRELKDWARFPRNLAAISGLTSLAVGLLAFLRLPGYAPVGRRLAVAAFSGIFVPSVVVATLLPAATLRPKLVIFGLAAANVLVTLLAMTAVRHRPWRGLRPAVACVGIAAFVSLAVVGLGQLAQSPGGLWGPLATLFIDHAGATQTFLLGLRHVGELAWLGVLGLGGWALATGGGSARRHRRIAIWLGVGAIVAVALFLAYQGVGHRFRLALIWAFRLGLVIDEAPAAYAIPLGLGLGATLTGLARPEPAARQLAMGLALWLAAGYAPHTPIQLLYLVLSALLITRSAQALDPDGEWRERQPWARLLSPPPDPGPPVRPGTERETFDDR